MGRHLKKKDFSTIYFFSMFNFGRPLKRREKPVKKDKVFKDN